MNAKNLGARLRSARKSRGLSQQTVALRLGLPRTAITHIEAGQRSVSTLELVQMAELYLVQAGDLLSHNSGDTGQDVLVALHRTAPGLNDDPATRKQIERCLGLLREGVALRHKLRRENRLYAPRYEAQPLRSSGDAVWQGEQVAEQERRRLGIANEPISDISGLIGRQGIWASSITLPDHMSGMFLRHSSIGMAILANFSHSRGRKRFSYAHEYAHALLDRNGIAQVSVAAKKSNPVEIRANAFAAAFLMPREGVRAFLHGLGKGLPSRRDHLIFDAASGSHVNATQRMQPRSQRIDYKDNAMLSRHFGVSYPAAAYRLKSLGYVSGRECSHLREQQCFGRQYLDMFIDGDQRGSEPHGGRELNKEIAHLAIEAYSRGEISRGRILELSRTLGVEGDRLFQFAEITLGE
ncbi:MAG: XRE family transcriptional regulator [Rhodobacteraceae bacterium]|nr:XRE family transcriptional regulator [Paracoccaceae bacterium]